jgi:peptidoglycan hydrolase CwlO-like protein
MASAYFKVSLVLQFFAFSTNVSGKIVSPETYAETILKDATDQELRDEYKKRRKLLSEVKDLPADIERDVLLANKPHYKMNMLKAVVREIETRIDKTQTVEELVRITDFFS